MLKICFKHSVIVTVKYLAKKKLANNDLVVKSSDVPNVASRDGFQHLFNKYNQVCLTWLYLLTKKNRRASEGGRLSDNTEVSYKNKGNFVITDRFIRILKKLILKYVAPILRNAYLGKLDVIAFNYNYNLHSTIKIKLEMLKLIILLNILPKLIRGELILVLVIM